MSGFLKWYRYLNILSVDIATGAVIAALFFAKILGVQILPYGLIALALTVWIIYTADHLRDAKSIKTTASTERHRFHQRNFNVLAVILLMAVCADLIIILYTRKPVLRWGIYLGVIVGIYLLVQRYLKFLKETLIALLYTLGVLLPSVSVTDQELTFFHFLLFIQFALVALMNLLIFSWFDHEGDLKDNQRSFSTDLGKRSITKVIFMIAVVDIMIGGFLLAAGFRPYATAMIMAMCVLHLSILFFSEHLRENDRYRYAADAIFFLPLIFVLWPRS
jgi:4-hydroxybenzoate polyprenyltransferase